MKWYLQALKKYAVFRGRARRREFWTFILLNMLFQAFLAGVESVIRKELKMEEGDLLPSVCSLAVLIPSIAVGVRRMHDTDRSGWWLLVPLLNLFSALDEGQRKDNRFGPDPKAATQQPPKLSDSPPIAS